MSTQKVRHDPGALDRQHAPQRRRSVGKKAGAFTVAAAIGLVAVALILVNRPGEDTTTPSGTPRTVNPADAAAEDAAMNFLDAYGAFDAKTAMTYVADDADTGLIDPQMPPDTKGVSLQLSFLEAQGVDETRRLGPCVDRRYTVPCRVRRHAIDHIVFRDSPPARTRTPSPRESHPEA